MKVQEKNKIITININKNNTLFHESTDILVPQYHLTPGCIWGIWFRESSASSRYIITSRGGRYSVAKPARCEKRFIIFLVDFTLQIFLKGPIWRRIFSVFSCFCTKILIHFPHTQSQFWPNLSPPNQLLT